MSSRTYNLSHLQLDRLNIGRIAAPLLTAVTAALLLISYEIAVTAGSTPNLPVAILLLAFVTIGLVLSVRRSSLRAAYWTGTSIALMVLSAVNFELGPWPHQSATRGVPYLLAGFFAAGAASYFDRWYEKRLLREQSVDARALYIRWPLLLVGMVLLLLVAEAGGQVLTGVRWSPSIDLQLILFVTGIVFVVTGLWGYGTVPHVRISNVDRRTLVALALITLLAFILRIWKLETGIHQFVDEMNFGRAVWGLMQPDAHYVPLLAPFSNVAAFPWIYPYLQTFGIKLLGWNLSALRIVSVMFGTISIPAIFLLARTIFDRKQLALAAALLLATFPPHVHFSRLGINNVADPLFGILMLFFLTRGLQFRHQRDFALAGAMLGLTQYFYEGGRVVFPLLAILWVVGLVVISRVEMDSHLLRRFLLFLATGAMVAAPLYYTLAAHNLPFLSRFRTAGLGGSYWHVLIDYDRQQTLQEHLTRPLLIYVRNPDLSEFYGGETALILVYVVPFFLFGLSYAIWRMRRPNTILLLLWILLVSVGGMVLAESGHAARFVVVFPAIVLLITLGLWYVSMRQPWIVLVLAATLAVVQVHYYFGEHLDAYNEQRRQFLDYQDAMFRVAEFPDGAQVCFIAETAPDMIMLTNMRDYLAPSLNVCQLMPQEVNATYLSALKSSPRAFFVEPDDEQSVDNLYAYFGTSLVGPLSSPYDGVPPNRQYDLYYAP